MAMCSLLRPFRAHPQRTSDGSLWASSVCQTHSPVQSPVAISSWTDDVVVTSLGLCDCLERRCCSEVPEEGGRPGRVLPHAYSPPWYYGYHLKMLEGRSCRSKTTGSDAASRAQLPPTWPVRMLAWSRVQPNLQEPNTEMHRNLCFNEVS